MATCSPSSSYFGYPAVIQFDLFAPHEGWSILLAISQGGLRAFDAERLLRSAQVSGLQCYALFRMSGFLDDPPRSAVKSTLKRRLRFRNLPIPRSAQPLCIPFLAHPTFAANVRTWIRGHIIRYKYFLVPFHLPQYNCYFG